MNKCHQYNKLVETKKFLEKLKQNGNRITKQRKKIVESIFLFDLPFSAEELLIKTKSQSIDLATIYRSLTLFSKQGLLTTVDFFDGVTRYEYCAEAGHHHHHIVCNTCKSIQKIDLCILEAQEQIIKNMGYQNITHKLEFFGTCQNCI